MVRAHAENVVLKHEPDVTFAFPKRTEKCVLGEGGLVDVASCQQPKHPRPARVGAKDRGQDLVILALVDLGRSLGNLDISALGCVVVIAHTITFIPNALK